MVNILIKKYTIALPELEHAFRSFNFNTAATMDFIIEALLAVLVPFSDPVLLSKFLKNEALDDTFIFLRICLAFAPRFPWRCCYLFSGGLYDRRNEQMPRVYMGGRKTDQGVRVTHDSEDSPARLEPAPDPYNSSAHNLHFVILLAFLYCHSVLPPINHEQFDVMRVEEY
ncbi:hypothetical protein Y032_0522g2879 [Ancylostoma ceylanicum]|uniref:Uncharacterized protein n=1 Tax=Ancylostoma ceylanicum TaxID=53326 RepID=A0A016WSR3_9BILA|nr:hypothetical protein Y032_0522g2879 [Ancylostoma ceylanicum]